MKYFTPELYLRFCSPDPDVADEATEEWERAASRYERHYKKIRQSLPESVRSFADALCLHDAEVFAPARLLGGRQEVIIVTQNVNTLVPESLNTLIILHYAVTEDPIIETLSDSSAFAQHNPVWLHDEFDLSGPDSFAHEILLSTGRLIKLRFRDFRYEVAKLVAPIRDTGLKDLSAERASPA
jgi:hypothetical protein